MKNNLKIEVIDIKEKTLQNGDVLKTCSEDKNLQEKLCAIWIPNQMRIKVVYLEALIEHKNPYLIDDVLRGNHFLRSESFEIIGNFFEDAQTEKIQLSFEFE